MKKFCAFVTCLLSCVSLSAQHTVSGTLQGWNEKIVYLYSYTGLEKMPIDSTYTDSQGGFWLDRFLETGMYVVETEALSVEFLYDNHKIQFVEHSPENIQFFGSPINDKWTAYITRRQHYRHNSEVLKQVLRQYDPQSDFYANAREEFAALQSGFGAFCDSLTKNDDYASRLIAADQPIIIDPATTVEQQRNLVEVHFFDKVDFNDTTLIPTNVLTTKMIDYISVVQSDTRLSPDPQMRMVLALNNIFERAKTNFTTYSFVLEYMLKGYSALGMTMVTDYLLNYPSLNEGEITAEQGRLLDAIAEPYQKVRVGAKAPQIKAVTIKGKEYDLYSSEKEYVIVFFWSTDCPYCHEFLTRIRKKLDLDDEFELLTFAVSDSEDDVESQIKSMKIKGLHFYDEARWDSPVFKDYHVFSTPTVFVLDKDRTIVCKPNDWSELNGWMRKGKAEVRR